MNEPPTLEEVCRLADKAHFHHDEWIRSSKEGAAVLLQYVEAQPSRANVTELSDLTGWSRKHIRNIINGVRPLPGRVGRPRT